MAAASVCSRSTDWSNSAEFRAAITPGIEAKLDAVLPPTWSGSNPVDIVGDADPARYAAALELLLADPGNDAVLVHERADRDRPADEIAVIVTELVAKYRQQNRGWSQAGARGLGRCRHRRSSIC